MNWNNPSRHEREDFKKLKAVGGSLKARWEEPREWDEAELDDEDEDAEYETPMEAAKLDVAGKWIDFSDDPRETMPGWKTSLRTAARH